MEGHSTDDLSRMKRMALVSARMVEKPNQIFWYHFCYTFPKISKLAKRHH